MALLQISEPGMSTTAHQHRLAAGIDLGTTNSLVATVRSGQADTLADAQGRHLLPSVVRYVADAMPIVGHDAKAAITEDPLNTIASAKRLMGRGVEDVVQLGGHLPYQFVTGESRVPRIHTAGGDVSSVEVSAEILRVLKRQAEDTLGGDLTGVVITVPAYFDDAQRQATRDAATLAGLHVYRLLNEPTAAAVAYGLDQDAEGVIAVYDLGGGTFDISILRLHKGVFEVLATGGDSALGGDDFDHVIAEWLLQVSGLQGSSDQKVLRTALVVARNAKEALTTVETTPVALGAWQGELTRHYMNKLIAPLVKKTLMACRRTLRDANLSKDEVKDVVMVGGSTRVLAVREQVSEFFGKPLLVNIDPDRVVAIGAAIQADVLAGNKPDSDMLLLDVIPLSLGLETMGGLVEKVIPRNTTIPVARAQEFTTFKDGQTAMSIHVLQGERDTVEACRSLARFSLRGIPPMVAGAARIRVTFQVDADGLLNVTAQEQTTGITSGVEVKPSYGLSDTEIETMLRDSMTYARDDMEARRLREQQVEADRAIEALDAALLADGDVLLTADERSYILTFRDKLVTLRPGNDYRAIEAGIKALEKAADAYVERRMNASIRAAMAGHRVDEF
ncbi:Fe-S protein assembly chaperone HscA [Thiothrix fructosivorans]|uniref:Chaperone protein HscA homolog n=1 Tax=Thiothrix fructosivorans TaxID=111770 RepID=A0A8B0SJP4_9GAMM|nr:Fe-S protein assembly chaperone HscA [Thiothrix fructosivorans]MBO0613341.1 Fe-S protein assembly chaperone HscA [Thiothrix fructosivorans]QTX11225.1 Fe-S protein assembly chaperone HscA [Thiothrix fructosivorans]